MTDFGIKKTDGNQINGQTQLITDVRRIVYRAKPFSDIPEVVNLPNHLDGFKELIRMNPGYFVGRITLGNCSMRCSTTCIHAVVLGISPTKELYIGLSSLSGA